MFVPQWPSLATTDNSTNSNNDDNDDDNEQQVITMNGHNNTADNNTIEEGGDTAKIDSTATSAASTETAPRIAESDSIEDEGIEISSLENIDTLSPSSDNNAAAAAAVVEGEVLQSKTSYDFALQQGSSEESDDDNGDDTTYQCQLWTATFPNNDDDNGQDDNLDSTTPENNSSNISDVWGGGGGDIWSTEAFAIPSPLQDILNSNRPLNTHTLLSQDELLQELRGCDVKLVEFFGREDVVAELVKCLICEVPYSSGSGGSGMDEKEGRERWCREEEGRRQLLKKCNGEGDVLKKGLEEQEVVNDDNDDDDETLRRKSKLVVSSPSCNENGEEEPNVETMWISPAASPENNNDTTKKRMGGGGEWLFNHCSDDDLNGGGDKDEENEEQRRSPEEEYDLRFVRYPYMACEVLCSEVGTTLDVLVDGYINDEEDDSGSNNDEGIKTPLAEEYDDINIGGLPNNEQPASSSSKKKKRILDLLFSVLIDTPPSSLDDRRAGYIEKMLVVLFRRRSQAMADYMNTSIILTNRSAPMAKQLLASSIKKENAGMNNTREEQAFPSTTIEKYPSLNAPPMLMCALLDHLHSHSIMHILQRLLIPSPLRHQGSKENIIIENDGKTEDAAVVESTESSEDDEDNPNSAMNNDFMNAINQINGNEQINLHDMDDEDVDVDDEDDLENDLTHLFQCDWSDRPDSMLALLLDRLEGKTGSFLLEYGFPVGYELSKDCDMIGDADVNDAAFSCSQHASEILVTIIQNSSLNSPVMISLSSDPALKRVLDIASLSVEKKEFVPYESIMTCAITVLESLVLQLGGYGTVGIEGGEEQEAEALESLQQTNFSEIGPHTPPPLALPPFDPATSAEVSTADTSALVSHLPVLLKELSSLLTHPITKTWLTPAQYTGGQPRLLLGTSRLRILRLVEALVLLGDASVDFDLQHSNILKHCVDMFWEFEWCSMLHQSVANLLVHVFESGEERSGLQEYFLENCGLLERLMDSFKSEEVLSENAAEDIRSDSVGGDRQDDVGSGENDRKKGTHDEIDAVEPVSDEDVDAAMEQEDSSMNENVQTTIFNDEPSQVKQAQGTSSPKQIRKGYMGHVIIICQALAHASSNAGDNCDEMVRDANDDTERQQENSTSLDAIGDLKQSFSTTSPLPKLHSSPNVQGTPVDNPPKPSRINSIIQRDPLLHEKWQQFVASTLAFETSVQSAPLGGQPLSNGPGELISDSQNQMMSINDDSDDFLGEPSGHLVFGGSGDMVGEIDMDENDLDIAASMMEHLSLSSSSGKADDNQPKGHNRRRSGRGGAAGSTESNTGHNFGSVIPTTKGFKDYIYDDPLGGVHPFDTEDDQEKNLNRGSEDDDIMSDAMVIPRDDKGTESTSSDESSVDDENEEEDEEEDGDVPVMDLFAGNVAFGNNGGSSPETDDWANFDSFDTDPSQKDDNAPKKESNSNGEDLFSKTPFDFVDTLEGDTVE